MRVIKQKAERTKWVGAYNMLIEVRGSWDHFDLSNREDFGKRRCEVVEEIWS